MPSEQISPAAVSVLLPVYNGQSFLAAAIESVLAQTFKDFELIIGDDVSTDRSSEIIQQFADSDARIRYLRNKENLGLFGNYNNCAQVSVGKLIKPFAQDDLLVPSALERMVQEFERRPRVSLVACAREYVSEEGQSLSVEKSHEDREIAGQQAVLDLLSGINNFIGEPCAVMYLRQHMGTGYLPKLPQLGDLEYWVRLLQHGDLFLISDPLCKFRVHGESHTRKNMSNFQYLADLMALQEVCAEALSKCGLAKEPFERAVVKKAIDMVSYATTHGVDYSRSDFAASKTHPREIGRLLLLALQRLAVLESSEKSSEAEIKNSHEENNRLRRELTDVTDSKSWKITAALRLIKKMLG